MLKIADDLEALPQYDKEIERLNSRIKDYQDACSQKQEIINGCIEFNADLLKKLSEIKKLVILRLKL
jgi:predicted  nucleic acid-binding Zn-ribbon protein